MCLGIFTTEGREGSENCQEVGRSTAGANRVPEVEFLRRREFHNWRVSRYQCSPAAKVEQLELKAGGVDLAGWSVEGMEI